jgi:hypothetical protein
MTETIAVPITLESLSAAIFSRVEVLTPHSPTDDLWAIIGLVTKLETALDKLSAEYQAIEAISTVAAA